MIKELSKGIAVLSVIFVLFAAGCEQAGTSSENPTPNPVPTVELTEAELLSAFSLTKGGITASAAAKRIENAAPPSGISFTKREIIAYDDEAGTFTVEVKGTKDGKGFSQKNSVTGFTHPLAGKTIQSIVECELNLDEGIEHNYSLAKYIEEVNKDPSGAKLVKKLSFLLSDFVTNIELGEHDTYTLTAKAQATDTQVWVKPSVVFRKLTEGGTETLVNAASFSFTHLKSQLTKDYFTKKDVFDYILGKIKNDESFIKTDSGSFASSVYAVAMVTQVAGDIFDENKISNYVHLYGTKGDGHLEIKNITAGIYNIRNDGIKADDYEGGLTVQYYIATKDLTTQATPPADQISELHTVTRSGFKKIVPETIKNEFEFKIGKIAGGNGTQQKWLDHPVDAVLIQKNEHPQDNYGNWFTINDSLTQNDSSGYYLILNDLAYSDCKPDAGHQFRLKTKSASDYNILVERLSLKKDNNEEYLKISMQFMGKSDTVNISVKPASY